MATLANWDDSFTTEETNDVCLQMSRVLASSISEGPLRDRVAGFLASNDIRSLCDLEIDYNGLSPNDAYRARQIRAFFEKRDDIDFGIDRKGVALDKFVESERWCADTNRLIKKARICPEILPASVHAVIHYARRKICDILGDLPQVEALRLRFGPGATTSIKKKNACPRVKLGAPFACSERMLPIAYKVLEECPGWIPFNDEDSVSVPVEIHTGKLSFVSKNWKTDRSTIPEPLLNSFVQLGIGDYMAERLRLFGQDIRDQTRNQRAARKGSITGELATLDLSSASDTVATELVWELLPFEWADFLDSVRTDRVTLPSGETMKLQKFSSMGNGFTFPLETLIFYGLAYGVCKNRNASPSELQVYGDDIIVPTHCYEDLCEVLSTLGFVPNDKKSFATGPFRESCGADYLGGINIRPCYLGSSLTGESLFTLHNYFRRNFEDEVADLLLGFTEPELRIFGPDGYGDGHLLLPFGQSSNVHLTPSKKRGTHGYGGYTFETYSWKPRKLRKSFLPGDRYLPGYSVYIRHHNGPIDEYYRSLTPQAWVPTFEWDKKGRLSCPLPGTRGYRRVKIYTFSAD